jgi:hypothetical protein
MKPWRNGSAFDSRSKGWGFKSLRFQFLTEFLPNEEGHAASECEVILGSDKRELYMNKIERIYRKNKNLGLKKRLHDYLVEIYFALELT